MDIEFLILADAVEVSNGKLYMLGGAWDEWRSSQYPTHVRLGIAVGLNIPWNETNVKHPVIIKVLNADGVSVMPEVTAQVEAGRPPGRTVGTDSHALFAINAGFKLDVPGRYEIRVEAAEKTKTVSFEAIGKL